MALRVGVGPQRHEGQLLGLLRGGLGELGASVAELADEQAGEAVEVALAVAVPDVGALTAHDDRHVGLLVAGVPGEVHPEVVARGLLEVGVVVDVIVLTEHVYRFLVHECLCLHDGGVPAFGQADPSYSARIVTESVGPALASDW